MKDAIKEYSEAIAENVNASKFETTAKIAKKKAHYRLVMASAALREMERELLNDWSPL